EGTGFVEHLKLPHYVDFQSELETIRRMRADAMDHGPSGTERDAGATEHDAGGTEQVA
ncbi:MAG: carbon-phosphorus lyase complex subunit PhnI, partial [Janthinobacterium lividum]